MAARRQVRSQRARRARSVSVAHSHAAAGPPAEPRAPPATRVYRARFGARRVPAPPLAQYGFVHERGLSRRGDPPRRTFTSRRDIVICDKRGLLSEIECART